MLLKPSSIVDSLSGKSGNIVIRRVGNQIIVADSAITTRNQSSAALLMKICFTKCCARWSVMTIVQKQVYSTNAKTFTFLDRFGKPFIPSGWQLFLSMNLRSYLSNDTYITDPASYAFFLNPNLSVCENLDLSAQTWNITSDATGDVYANTFLYFTGPHKDLSAELPTRMKFLYCHANNTAFSVNLWPYVVAAIKRNPIVNEYYTLWYIAQSVRSGNTGTLLSIQKICVP